MSDLSLIHTAVCPQPEASPADVLAVLRARRRLATLEHVDEYQRRQEVLSLERLQRVDGYQVLKLLIEFPILQKELRRA